YPHWPLGADEGLWIRPCAAIHTCFLPAPIDVVFLDGDAKELRRIDSMPAWRAAAAVRPSVSLAGARRAWSVVARPAGYCTRHPQYFNHIRFAIERLSGPSD